MIELLQLECVETYTVGVGDSAANRAAESSRRTVWSVLIADDSLTVAFGYAPNLRLNVTIPTPCNEEDWEFGSIPIRVTPKITSGSLMANTVSTTGSHHRAYN